MLNIELKKENNLFFKSSITLIVVVGLVFSFYFFNKLNEEMAEKKQIEFESLFERKTALIENELNNNLNILLALKSYSNSSTSITRNNFKKFVQQFLDNEDFNGLHAISWVPRVLHKDRLEYENRLKKELNYDFKIKQKDENGKIIYAKNKADYFSVDYIEPYELNKKAQGYDISSNKIRNQTLIDAKIDNSTRITGKIKLVQETQNGFGFLGVLPIFDDNQNLLGYYSAVFRINDIINKALNRDKNSNNLLNLEVYDITTNDDDFLFSNTKSEIKNINSSENIQIAGRLWKVVAEPTSDFLRLHNSNLHFILLFFHILVIILLIVILTYINNKKRQHEEIILMNSKLVTMGEMIDIIAHQWSQPLTSINLQNSMNEYLLKHNQFEDKEVFANIENINLNVDHLKETLANFRNFVRPDSSKKEFTVKHAIDKSLKIYSHLIKINSIEISIDIKNDVKLYGYENQFIHIFLNLISNTKDAIVDNNIKNKKIRITIDENEIIYKDNAGGIPENIIKDIFNANVTSKKDGTGMGMYMSKKIANNNNCDLEVKNCENGAEFKISLLKN